MGVEMEGAIVESSGRSICDGEVRRSVPLLAQMLRPYPGGGHISLTKETVRPSVLSIIEEYLGHKTYGQLMRQYFNQSDNCGVDFYWYNEEKEFLTRVVNRLLSYRPSNQWMQEQHITLHLLRIQLGFACMTRRLLWRKLKQQNILHFHTQPLAYLATDLMTKIPTVVTIDRTIAQASREKTHPAFQWTFVPNNFLEKRVFQTAAKVVSFSEAARRSVIEDYQIDENKVQVIYPGVDLQQIPQRIPVRCAESPFQILFIGGDFKRKGGDDLLQVFLEQFADRAELHLVTTAPIECDHPKVHIYRHIQAYTPEWLALYHQADVFVLPTYSEPLGWVFIEAMAAGLPIIATHHNAIPEIVSHGETGFLVPPGDRPSLAHHLQVLLEHPELGIAMGIRGRQIAEQKFDVNQHFQKLELLFQEIGGEIKP
jgi:glycosyltransferase involved in cell wall biosynthesis